MPEVLAVRIGAASDGTTLTLQRAAARRPQASSSARVASGSWRAPPAPAASPPEASGATAPAATAPAT
eukprot:15478586-Alexandrium_andersonii.AAC.1